MEDVKYMRMGVSDWEFIFKDESAVKLNTIQSQSFVYGCNGDFIIKLVDALIDKDIIEHIKKRIPLKCVTEAYRGWNKAVNACETYNETYETCSIDKIEVKCSTNYVSLCDILIIVK